MFGISSTSSSEVKKGFWLGIGVAGALIFVGFATGVVRTAVK